MYGLTSSGRFLGGKVVLYGLLSFATSSDMYTAIASVGGVGNYVFCGSGFAYDSRAHRLKVFRKRFGSFRVNVSGGFYRGLTGLLLNRVVFMRVNGFNTSVVGYHYTNGVATIYATRSIARGYPSATKEGGSRTAIVLVLVAGGSSVAFTRCFRIVCLLLRCTFF